MDEFQLLGFWGFGVLGFWGIGDVGLLANTSPVP